MTWVTSAGRIAVVVPCVDEAAAVGAVVDDLRAALPEATVWVYDNASTDGTAAVAAAHGAEVRREPVPGKGAVVRRAFADVDADVYVLVDGDGTYDASAAADLVEVLLSGPYDVVVGARRPSSPAAYRPGHAAGNRGLNRLVALVFGTGTTDMLSGYRVMSRRFVKTFPARSRGFEVETELTVHAAALRVPQVEVPVAFCDRPAGSASKLRTVRDGARILGWVARLAHAERPLAVHALLAALLAAAALLAGSPLAAAVLAAAALATGAVLGGLRRSRHEALRLAYLQHRAPGGGLTSGRARASSGARTAPPGPRTPVPHTPSSQTPAPPPPGPQPALARSSSEQSPAARSPAAQPPVTAGT
ncbi:glycosyltransferase [Quadrisphaera sp. KR29]|uniref:glycosyltransferase n=1 Tax=Quadrisphaera sp. KR29 TaxID=3461391 RepID=UPI0040443C7C